LRWGRRYAETNDDRFLAAYDERSDDGFGLRNGSWSDFRNSARFGAG